MEETEVEELTPDKIYQPTDLVWVKISGMWWPCEVMDQEKLAPVVTGGLKNKPLVVVKFLQEEDAYEFVKSYDIIYHYNCKRKDEFLTLGFKKYNRLKNEKNMALFPSSIQEAEQRTGGNPEIINDPKYQPQVAQGKGRSSLPADFKGSKNSTAPRRSAPGSSKDGGRANGVDKTKIKRPPIVKNVKQGPTWYPYPKQITVIFPPRRQPPSDDPSFKQTPLLRCSVCCFQTSYHDLLMLHCLNNQHNTSAQPGKYRWGNPLNKRKITGVKKAVVRRRKDGSSTSAEKGSAKKKKKALPPVPVSRFTPPKKPKMSLLGTPNSLEVSQECAKIIEEWTDDEDENKACEAVNELDCSASSIDNTMGTTTEAADLEKNAEEPNLNTSTPKIDKPSGPPKSSSCFDFDDEESSEPGLQSSGKFGQIRLPRVITPEKSKPPDPLDDGNDIDSLLKEVSVPDIPSLPTSKQDSLFSRGDRTYGSSPFKDTKKPGMTSPIRSDSNKDKNADIENNKHEEKHFLAKGPLQSKKRKSFGRTEGAEDGSDVENKSKAGACPLKPSNDKKVDGKTSSITDETIAAEKAKQSLIDTLTYSPKSDDQVQEMADPKKLPGDEAQSNEVSRLAVDIADIKQSTPKSSRKNRMKKSLESTESLPANEISKREAVSGESESPGSGRNKRLKSSRKMPMSHSSQVDSASDADVMKDSQSTKSTVDISDSIQSTPKQSRRSSRNEEHSEPPSLALEKTYKREASPEEPGSARSRRRNKKFKSSEEMPELQLAEADITKETMQSPGEHAPSNTTRSKKSRKDKSPENDPKVQPESESVPGDSDTLLDSYLGSTAIVGVSQEITECMDAQSVQSAPRKSSRRKTMSQMPAECPSVSVDETLKREASPEEPESTRSRRRNKKLKSSQEVPELLPTPVDSTSKVDITQHSVGFINSPSSEQVISSKDIIHESVVEKAPRGSKKSKKFESSSGETNLLPVLSEMHKLPEPDMQYVERFPEAADSHNSADSIRSPSRKPALPSNDMAQESEAKKSSRTIRKTQKGAFEVQPEQPVVSVDDTSRAYMSQEDAETGNLSSSEQALPSNDIAASKKPGRSLVEERNVHPHIPVASKLLSIPEDTLNTDITQESSTPIESSSCKQVLKSNDITQDLVSVKSPRESRKTEKRGSSEGEQKIAVNDNDSEPFKSPTRVTTVKESPKIDERHKASRRSQRNRSQEVPVSIPLPEDLKSADQNIPQESSDSPTSREASKSLISSQVSMMIDDYSRVSRRSKRLNSQEVPVSIPLPDFPSEKTSKIPVEISESQSPIRGKVSHERLSSPVDKSPKSSKMSNDNFSTVEMPVSTPLPEKGMTPDGSATSDLINSEGSPRLSWNTRESKAIVACELKTLPSVGPIKSDSTITDLGKDSEAEKPPIETTTLALPEDSKAGEQESKKYKLLRVVPAPIESVALEREEEPKPVDGSTVLIEAMACNDSKSQLSAEPYYVESIPPAEELKPLKSPTADKTLVTEDSDAIEPHLPSRKSRRIASRDELISKSPCGVDTHRTESKANEQSCKKSKSRTLSQQPEPVLLSVESKDDPMGLKHESVAFDSKSQEPHYVEGIPPLDDSEPLRSSSVDDSAILADDSKTECLTPSRKSKRISSQELQTLKPPLKVDSTKTETTASEIPLPPNCDPASKGKVEDVTVTQRSHGLRQKGTRQETEKMPEAIPMLEEDKPFTTNVPSSHEACEDLGKNVELAKKEISSKPLSQKGKYEPKSLPKVVTPKPDHKTPSKEIKPKEKERTSHSKEKGIKSSSKGHRHETSRRESRSASKEAKDEPKVSPYGDRSRNEPKSSKRRSISTEKKRKDELGSTSKSTPASQVNVDTLVADASASSLEPISNKAIESESPCKDKAVRGALSPSKDVAPLQKSVVNIIFDGLSPRKKKSKWDVEVPKVEGIMGTVETEIATSDSGAVMSASEISPSGLKPLEITVFDCSKNEVAIDKDLAVSSPKKQMAHSPSKTFRQDEPATLLEELLGSSPKSSPTSSPKKTNSVSPIKVPLDSPGRRKTADIKFSLSPSKVLDFGFPPKLNDASENRTVSVSLSPSNAESGMVDTLPAPVRASRWDSPVRSSGIRSSTPTQSLGVSPAKTPTSPGRKVKVWEIKSGARSSFKSSPENNVTPEKPRKLPVHLEPDSSNNQSDDDLTALQAEIMSYSPMDQAKSTPAPVVMKEVSDLVKELEDPPNSLQLKSSSLQTVQAKAEPFSSPNKSIDTKVPHVSPEAIPLPPDNLLPFKPSGLSEVDLLANLSDAITIPLDEPVTAESVTPLSPGAISCSKPSTTPNLIVVPPSGSTHGSESISCFGNERQSMGNGLANNFGSGEMLLDINSMLVIMDDSMPYSEPPVATTKSTSSTAVPNVSSEPVSSVPLTRVTSLEQPPQMCVVSSAPGLTTGQVQTSTPSVTVPSVCSIPLPPEPSGPKSSEPEPEEVSKEEIIETEIVMDHSETEQQDLSTPSCEEKFAQALVKQPWLRPDLLEVLSKRATGKKVYEAKRVTQLVISLYDEEHPDFSYYMSLPGCTVGTGNYTPSWANVGPGNPSSIAVTSPTKPIGANSPQTTANSSAAQGLVSKSIVTLARPETEVGDSSKPVSPAKAAGAQVKQKILQILHQFQSGKYDADTARKLESLTSRPGLMDKINQQQKIMVSSQLPTEVQQKKTIVNPAVRASPATKTMTSVPGSSSVSSPKAVMVVNTSNARVVHSKPNILSAGREPLKFTMEPKYRNIQVSSSNQTKYVVVPDPVTGIPAVKQQIVIRNTNTTQSGHIVSAVPGRIVPTQTNSTASPGRIVTTKTNSTASPGRTVSGSIPTFTVVSSRSPSTMQTVVSAPGRSTLVGKTLTTVPGSSTVKVSTALPQPRQRPKTVAQPSVVPTSRLANVQPQTVRVRKQSLSQTQFVQRPATKTETITYVTIPNNMVIPTSSEQLYVLTKKKPPSVAPNSDILAEALAGAEIPLAEDPSPDILSPSSVVITGSLGADQLSTMSFDPAETDNVNR